jgi:uncharacterized protein
MHGRNSTAPPSPRVTLGRYPERGRYDFATIASILDEGLVCHVGLVADGQPFVIPTTYARIGRCLYIQGSPLARWMRALQNGGPLCVTVTLLDGLVLARSAFRHSMNYRYVVALGRATVVEKRDEKMRALRALIEHVAPGRWSDGIRHPSQDEIRATLVLRIALDEASAKARAGPPADLQADLRRQAWAGCLPLRLGAAAPVADPAIAPGIRVPHYAAEYRRSRK